MKTLKSLCPGHKGQLSQEQASHGLQAAAHPKKSDLQGDIYFTVELGQFLEFGKGG